MKHLELHILQSFPVACLNRDDLNSPKTAIFGGVQRARASSQSWKWAIRREMAKEMNAPAVFNGNRSRRMVSELARRLKNKGITMDIAVIIAEQVASIVETLDSKKDADGFKKIKTMMFFSKAEYDAIANAVTNDITISAEKVRSSSNAVETAKETLKMIDDETKHKTAEKTLEKLEKELEKEQKALRKAFNDKAIREAIKSVQLKDAADIALFGRMVANDHSLTVEGAAMFNHALSTHKVDNELDFFAAVDDLQPKEEAGAGMTGTLEFNSATYYRFAALNLDMLADEDHLGDLNQEERRKIVEAFIRATLMAIPVARKNSMNANTLPGFVLGIVREEGHPIQLVNAFENPVKRTGGKGLFDVSQENLLAEYEKLKQTWDLNETVRVEMPRDGLKKFIAEVVNHAK